MNQYYSTHWLEETVDKIRKRNPLEITLSTGKTPSGHIHIGILREIIICDALRRIFERNKKKVNFNLFIDDFDAAKRFPNYIDKDFAKEHLGKPFSLIPCPFKNCDCKSYAKHFGNELIETLPDFGIKNKIIWTFNLYQETKMQKKIKIALDNTEEIKNILRKYILPTLNKKRKEEFLEMQKTWIPVMVLCEKCDKLQKRTIEGSIKPNRVVSYNKQNQTVSYQCPACGHKGVISIYSGKLKLNWRIDWPAKWSIFETTFEPAGKDHSVKGGAYDTGLEICREIFNYKGPIKLPYEFLRFGEKDMGTSKGIVFTPNKYLKVADPEIFRMLILKTNPMKHISLRIEEIPQYYNYYEKMEELYYFNEKADSKQELKLFNYLYPLVKTHDVPEIKPKRIPFKLLVFLTQIENLLNMDQLYQKALHAVNANDQEISFEEFKSAIKRTENWLKEVKDIIAETKDIKKKKYIINKLEIFSIPEKINKSIIKQLDEKQISGISKFKDFILNDNLKDSDLIQNEIFTIAKQELKISPRKLFEAIYLVILGQNSGPRLGPFICMLDKEWLLERLNQISA